MNNMKRKLVIYEINELPRNLLEHYIRLKPDSGFARLVKNGTLLDTYCENEGELHPWSTWPTFYRGVDNRKHKINYINQDLTPANREYPPVWQILNDKQISTGIFGTLQSYPPCNHKYCKFHLPDTFAPTSDAFPIILKTFQLFNFGRPI